MPGMSAEMYTIIGVGIALAALILNGQAATRRALAELRQEMNELRAEMHREFAALREEIAALRKELAALAERVARLEGVILGPRDFARDSGAGNTA